jgi:hypothetical protein
VERLLHRKRSATWLKHHESGTGSIEMKGDWKMNNEKIEQKVPGYGEPWKPYRNNKYEIRDRDDEKITEVFSSKPITFDAVLASRIIETVNACKGVGNLPEGIVGRM